MAVSHHSNPAGKTLAEAVLHSIPQAILVLNGTGEICFANKNIFSMLNLDQKLVDQNLLIGTKPDKWLHDKHLSAFITRCSSGSKDKLKQDSFKIKSNHDSEKTVSVVTYPLSNLLETQCVEGTLLMFRDITAETTSNHNKKDFIENVAHELKSPLNILGLYSEALLDEDGKNPDFRAEACKVIFEQVDSLSRLINNLLHITKIESGDLFINKNLTSVVPLIKDLISDNEPDIQMKSIDLSFEMTDEISLIFIDQNLMRIAINNLLINAIKYTPVGGNIKIVISESTDCIKIKVVDSGIGISDEEKYRIFEKFFRSDNSVVRQQAGHGLGLFLAKEIINLHNGHLLFKSTKGMGSEFTIELNKK